MSIEPHTSLEGPQFAGWTLRGTSPAEHRLREQADVAVPLPDDIVLRADVFRPREPGSYPALVSGELHTLGERLAAHVRLEGRELFPLLETVIPVADLTALACRLEEAA